MTTDLLSQQVLYSLIQQIASYYEGDELTLYQNAAADFRIPYFDWATLPPAGESLLPFSVGGRATVNASGPNGVQTIANPLYTYQFKPLNSTAFIQAPVGPLLSCGNPHTDLGTIQYNQWLTTVRAPTSDNGTAKSNDTKIALALDRNFPSFQQRLYNLFSNYGNYSTFSNEGWIPEGQENHYDSIESLHDTIHTLTGLGGHMAWIPFSSFDPIFFLHHTMVDRVFAMWQVLYPTSWITPTPAATNSYTTSEGQIQDAQTPLTPFYANTDGTFWTSDAVRDTHVFGYSYPEIAGLNHALQRPNARAQARVRAAINRLYGGSSPASLAIGSARKRDINGRVLPADPRSARKYPVYQPSKLEGRSWMGSPSSPRLPPAGKILTDNKYREWTANIRVIKQALEGPFFIHLFFGDPVSPNPQAWAFGPNLAGTLSVFASPPMPGMQMGGKVTSGTVPLTSALMKKVTEGEVDSLHPEVIEPYLKANLKLRVVKTDGTVVDPATVQGLKIGIVSSEVKAPASDEELPSWEGQTVHFDLI